MMDDSFSRRLRLRCLPFLDWLRGYRLSALRRDGIAGATVAVVLIPQSMAYAMLAGLPPQYGLYAAAVTPIVAALWGSLRQLATGPIAIMSLLVLTTLTPLAPPGSPRFIELAFVLSFMVGALYLLIGCLRLGVIMSFISHATVKGFTASAAIIIISTQLPHLSGIPVGRHESLIPALAELAVNLPELHLPTLALGAGAFALIYGTKRRWPHFPAALVAIVLLTTIVYLFDLGRAGVRVIGEVPGGMPRPHLPHFDSGVMLQLLGSAIVIALVSFAETYSVGKAVSSQTKQKVDVNQEFIGQGLANLAGAFFQCYPVSGSLSRTAMAYATGARTGIAAGVSSAAVVLTLLFLTPLFTHIPRAALSALVISAVLLLFHPVEVFTLWKKSRHDGAVAVIVFVLALTLKLDYALLIGVIISLVLYLWKTMHPRIVEVTKDLDTPMFVNVEAADGTPCPQLMILRIDDAIFFANAEYTIEHIETLLEQRAAGVRYLLLDFKGVGFVDLTAADELTRLVDDLEARGVGLLLISPHLPVRRVLESCGLVERLGEEHIFASYSEAIATIFAELDHEFCRERCSRTLFPSCGTVRPRST
jgi:SulP family sulfate permease